MEQKNKFAEMNDDSLNQVVGGYLVVSAWKNYVTDTVTREINSMMLGASDNDRAILNSVYSVFQGTMIPGAAVAGPIRNLWSDFNVNYQNRLESQNVKARLCQVIYDANKFISENS